MATKDWKKQNSYRNQYSWKKGDKLLVVLSDNFTNPYWYIVIDGNRRGHFKTKSQALKFARAYMRKH